MKNYRIANYLCKIKGDIDQIGDNYRPFEISAPQPEEKSLFEMKVTIDAGFTDIEQGILIGDYPDVTLHIKVFKLDGKLRLLSYIGNTGVPLSLMECSEDFSDIHLIVINQDSYDFAMNNAMMILFTCAFALRGDTVLFHSSVIVHKDKAYMFLGKSGTGKSTHTGLWLKHIEGSHLLNDDNPAVRIEDGKILVYGTPWSGKTPCYRSASYPVGGIVRLWQAPENKMVQLKPSAAFASILPTVSNLPCSEAVTAGVRNCITEIIEKIPVFRFDCLPNEDAAQLSFKMLNV